MVVFTVELGDVANVDEIGVDEDVMFMSEVKKGEAEGEGEDDGELEYCDGVVVVKVARLGFDKPGVVFGMNVAVPGIVCKVVDGVDGGITIGVVNIGDGDVTLAVGTGGVVDSIITLGVSVCSIGVVLMVVVVDDVVVVGSVVTVVAIVDVIVVVVNGDVRFSCVVVVVGVEEGSVVAD